MRRRRRRILWGRVLALLSAVAGAIGFIYVYFFTGTFTIHAYDIQGAPEEYVEQLRDDMNILAEQKLFFVLPGNRVISFHDDDMRTLVKETLTNTSIVRIYPTGLHTLRVSIRHYVPLFSVSDTHAITEDGVIYKEIIPLHDFPRLHLASSTEVTRATFLSLSKLVEKLSAVVYPIEHIDIDEHDDIRLYDKDRKTAIILSSSSDMDKVWSNIISAIDTNPLKSKIAKDIGHLQYLDTRFGNKVFYKFTNGSGPAIIPSINATTTATTTLR